MSNGPDLDYLARLSTAISEEHNKTLQEIGRTHKGAEMQAICMGFIGACSDYLRVTYGPEKAAEVLYLMADRAAERTAVNHLDQLLKRK